MSYEYDPGTDGLTSLGYADFEPDGCYEWDGVTAYVRTEDKRFFWENGSGCSCNSPMEYINKLDDFESGTFAEFATVIIDKVKAEMESTYHTPRAKAEILESVQHVFAEAVKYA